jgi:hypothetical protein
MRASGAGSPPRRNAPGAAQPEWNHFSSDEESVFHRARFPVIPHLGGSPAFSFVFERFGLVRGEWCEFGTPRAFKFAGKVDVSMVVDAGPPRSWRL